MCFLATARGPLCILLKARIRAQRNYHCTLFHALRSNNDVFFLVNENRRLAASMVAAIAAAAALILDIQPHVLMVMPYRLVFYKGMERKKKSRKAE